MKCPYINYYDCSAWKLFQNLPGLGDLSTDVEWLSEIMKASSVC